MCDKRKKIPLDTAPYIFGSHFFCAFSLCATFRLSLLELLVFRCSKVLAGTQTRTFVKENLVPHVHGQIICHRKFAIEN